MKQHLKITEVDIFGIYFLRLNNYIYIYAKLISVSFYKRAQILIGDLWSCFEGEGYGSFYDIDSLSMFADYR